jgi:hypothetical protein
MLQRTKLLTFVFSMGMVGCSDNKLGNNGQMMPDMAQILDLTVAPDLMFPNRDPSNHPQLPQVDNLGGDTLSAPNVWTIVWPGDEALGAKANTFVRGMLGSDYWTGSLGEYGVGAGTANGVYVMPSTAPKTIDDSTFTKTVKSVVAALPTPVDGNTILAFIIPKSSTSTMGGGMGCQDYGGYHSQTKAATGSTANIAYAVNLQCDDPTLSPFDALTDVMSHELAEASTDPFPRSAPGWADYNDNGADSGGEIGDLCVFLDTHITVMLNDGDAGEDTETYNVQRLYSQKVAKTGAADPCVPAPSTPYFNAALDPSDINITLDTSGNGNGMMKLEPYAYGAVGPITWQIYGLDGSGVSANPSKGTANAGETIRINYTANSTAKQTGGVGFLMVETQTSDGVINEWFGSISVK